MSSFVRNLVLRAAGLTPVEERDVHLLAPHYHWSENEILAMTPGRRGRYVQRLLDSLSERRRA